MSDHVHEWSPKSWFTSYEDGAYCQECKQELNTDEITLRLNATEKLSVRDAKIAKKDSYADIEWGARQPWQDAVAAYAAALEDPDGR